MCATPGAGVGTQMCASPIVNLLHQGEIKEAEGFGGGSAPSEGGEADSEDPAKEQRFYMATWGRDASRWDPCSLLRCSSFTTGKGILLCLGSRSCYVMREADSKGRFWVYERKLELSALPVL